MKSARMPPAVERRLIEQAQAGDQDAMARLLRQHDRFIWKVAVRTRARGMDVEDLLQVGRMAMITAILKFNLSLGVKLTTFAYTIVCQRCQEAAFSQGVVRLPLCARAIDPEAANRAMGKRGEFISLDMPRAAEDDQPSTWGERIPVDQDHVSEICDAEERLHLRAAVERLPERERVIVERRLAGETLRAIGDSDGVVKERIRQLEQRAWARLREWIASDAEPMHRAKKRSWKSGNRPPSRRMLIRGR